MDRKIVFFHVGSMNSYKGLKGGDSIQGGGDYVKVMGFGHEIFNFEPFKGQMYGYVQPSGRGDYNRRKIHIERLGASKQDVSVHDIDVVWTAKNPHIGSVVIIGWYKNATVYRQHQQAPEGSGRNYLNNTMGYYCSARAEDCVLLPPDRRVITVPLARKVNGGKGQSNIWYAESPVGKSFREVALQLINSGKSPTRFARKNNMARFNRQPDPEKRKHIEVCAVSVVRDFYENEGYEVSSVESDNVGWDLEALYNDYKLRIEVKGLSSKNLSVELTANEFNKMKEYRDTYRLAIVTEADTNPSLCMLYFNSETQKWEDFGGRQADFEEQTSARVFVSNSH